MKNPRNTPLQKLVVIALDHIGDVSPTDRPELLDAAADVLPSDVAQCCRATAAALRITEAHQLQLSALLRTHAA